MCNQAVSLVAAELERRGIATVVLQFLREIAEKVRPPRALWVPFELGRPLGVPNDPAFQTRVLKAMLALLDAKAGPMLADYPEDAPGGSATDMSGMACPIRFDRKGAAEETLEETILREIRELQPWYDLAFERRQRTTFGSSRLAIEDVAKFLARWQTEMPPASPHGDEPPEAVLKLAAEDLKVFYLEALTGRRHF